jgi:hypothetical protein
MKLPKMSTLKHLFFYVLHKKMQQVIYKPHKKKNSTQKLQVEF